MPGGWRRATARSAPSWPPARGAAPAAPSPPGCRVRPAAVLSLQMRGAPLALPLQAAERLSLCDAGLP